MYQLKTLLRYQLSWVFWRKKILLRFFVSQYCNHNFEGRVTDKMTRWRTRPIKDLKNSHLMATLHHKLIHFLKLAMKSPEVVFWDWDLNSGLCTCKSGALWLQSILLWLFWRWSLKNYLPGLALNCNPPDLSLPSTWDYKCEYWHLAPLKMFSWTLMCRFKAKTSNNEICPLLWFHWIMHVPPSRLEAVGFRENGTWFYLYFETALASFQLLSVLKKVKSRRCWLMWVI
jgi:hypothetical protein